MKEISKASKVWLEIMKLAKENDIDLSTTENITNFLKRGFKDVIEGALAADLMTIWAMKRTNIAILQMPETEQTASRLKAALVNLLSMHQGIKKALLSQKSCRNDNVI